MDLCSHIPLVLRATYLHSVTKYLHLFLVNSVSVQCFPETQLGLIVYLGHVMHPLETLLTTVLVAMITCLFCLRGW